MRKLVGPLYAACISNFHKRKSNNFPEQQLLVCVKSKLISWDNFHCKKQTAMALVNTNFQMHVPSLVKLKQERRWELGCTNKWKMSLEVMCIFYFHSKHHYQARWNLAPICLVCHKFCQPYCYNHFVHDLKPTTTRLSYEMLIKFIPNFSSWAPDIRLFWLASFQHGRRSASLDKKSFTFLNRATQISRCAAAVTSYLFLPM